MMWPQLQQTTHNVSALIFMKLSAQWCLPLNYKLFFQIESWSSMLVTVILKAAVLFFRLTRMISMAVGDSTHCGVQPSFKLLGPASIFSCINSLPPVCLPYLYSLTSFILSLCHLSFPVTSMMAESIYLAAVRIVLLGVGSIMLLVADISISPLRILLSLYDRFWGLTCERIFSVQSVKFIATTISACSFRNFSCAPLIQGKRILLFTSVGFLTAQRNAAAAVLSCTV